ncbi:hypothetical protein PIB30_003199 [Stylosanthes scabra]|uniref:Peptidase metallopeptidase domain-containing protein n=1 Tax=Stylosanthes scabra TaxID=79078 RepID=A0ABU6Q324_9FABA|nr:hypothetical protein [Stylosanthes scabra]
MKRHYLVTLLLFFLFLLDSSLSISPGRPFARNSRPFGKGFYRTKPTKKEHKCEFDYLRNQSVSPPPPPGAAPEKIQGLHFVKQYLNDYGYIQDSDNYTDLLDQETISAIETYQTFFNLPVTGDLDNETLQQLSLYRCAVPDVNFTYSLSPTNNVSWPKGIDWFSNRTNLTYGFLPASEITEIYKAVFRDSFKRWSEAITTFVNLTLTEARYNESDIKIGFYIFDNNTVGAEVVGVSVIELVSDNNEYVAIGDMLLDATKYWALPNDTVNSTTLEYGMIDLGDVVMHQIGHLLGLSHSSHNESVMYPYILPQNQRKVQLSNDDKQQIQQVYSTNHASSGVGIMISTCGFLTTTFFSLGFSCIMFLLY